MIKRIIFFLILTTASFADGHILGYHRFGGRKNVATNISIKTFKAQLNYLKNHYYKVVPLRAITDKIEKKEEIPDNWVAITIDDGYRSFFKVGYPILKKYKFPFTVFANSQPIDAGYRSFMTWRMLKVIDNDPLGDVQSHSWSHPSFPDISNKRTIKEVKLGKSRIEKMLNKKVDLFAYPYGEYDDKTIEALKKTKHTFAFKYQFGAVSHLSSPYLINRIGIKESTNLSKMLNSKHLPVIWKKVRYNKKRIYSISINLPSDIKEIQVHQSGYRWKWYKVNNGVINLNRPFKFKRTLILLRDKNKRIDYYLITNYN